MSDDRSEIVGALESAGRGMANLCFNLSQQDTIPASVRMSMKKAQGEWDAALRAFVNLERGAAPPPQSHVWGEAKAEDCVLSIGSQRVCAHGTLGCVNHHTPQSPAAGWTPPQDCDGKEQLAFEAWASGERYDMNQHPLHYLFLDKRTNAARQGWKAALRYVREQHALAATEASDHG